MTLKPSIRRFSVAAALAAVCVILDYFLPTPHFDPASFGWSLAIELVVG